MAATSGDDALAHYGERTPGITGRDRLMMVVIVLSVLMGLDAAATFLSWRSASTQIDHARIERSALQCLDLVDDGPYRESALPSPCRRPEVAVLIDQFQHEMAAAGGE